MLELPIEYVRKNEDENAESNTRIMPTLIDPNLIVGIYQSGDRRTKILYEGNILISSCDVMALLSFMDSAHIPMLAAMVGMGVVQDGKLPTVKMFLAIDHIVSVFRDDIYTSITVKGASSQGFVAIDSFEYFKEKIGQVAGVTKIGPAAPIISEGNIKEQHG